MKSLKTPHAVLLGAALIAGALYLSAISGYRYQITAAPSPTRSYIWMIDKFTGELWMCTPDAGGPACFKQTSN
jgi:hypothetical protein